MNQIPPVQVDDKLDLHIESVGAKGDGIAKVQGYVLFVPNTEAGEKVRAVVTRTMEKFGFAEVIEEFE